MTATPIMTAEQMLAQIAKLQAENKALLEQRAKPNRLSFKVSEKGAISVYGLGKFPVTLYRGSMERLLAASDDIKAFIEANASLLAVKRPA